MHDAKVIAPRAAHDVGEAMLHVDQRGFDFESRLVVKTVAMNDMAHLEPCQLDLSNVLELQIQLIFYLSAAMGENPITLALADVESLSFTWIDQPIDIGLQLIRHFRWEASMSGFARVLN